LGPYTLAVGKEAFLKPSGDGPYVALEVDDFDDTIERLRRHRVPLAPSLRTPQTIEAGSYSTIFSMFDALRSALLGALRVP